MKKRLLKLLVCSECKGGLDLDIFEKREGRIFAGKLTCKNCNLNYPIINFIPRMLLDDLRKEVLIEHPYFFKKFKKEMKNYLSRTKKIKIRKKQILKKRTLKSFGYQWRIFKKMTKEFERSFLHYINPIKRDFFKGKLGLDAGCGFGRHMYYASKFGAETIGMDLSEACEVAYKNTKVLGNVHIVQGDIYNPPFKKEIFDFVYCIGVLHHLPKPKKGFESLVKLVKQKGDIFIWVYRKKRHITRYFLEFFRKITNKIPFRLLYVLCFICSIIDWSFIFMYKMLSKNKVIKRILDPIILPRIKMYAQYPYQVCFADWFDRLSVPIRFYYTKIEILNWFQQNNLKNIFISYTGKYGIRAKGRK